MESVCKSCGHQLSENSKYCPNCGKSNATSKNKSLKILSDKKTMAIVGIILIIVILLLVLKTNIRTFGFSSEEMFAYKAVELLQKNLDSPSNFNINEISVTTNVDDVEDAARVVVVFSTESINKRFVVVQFRKDGTNLLVLPDSDLNRQFIASEYLVASFAGQKIDESKINKAIN